MAKPLVAVLTVCCVALTLAQECPDTPNYCTNYPNIRAGPVSLAVNCSQTHVNITISNRVSGGLLEYTCNSSNVSCIPVHRGSFFMKDRISSSVPAYLSPGTCCVVFGCYYYTEKSTMLRLYQFEETWCTVPAVIPRLDQTSSNSTVQIPTKSLDLVSASMMATTTVPSPVQSTVMHVPEETPTPSGASTNADQTATLFVSSVSNIVLVIIGAMVTILAVLGSVLLLVLIIRKIRREKSLINTEWFDSNYRPVKITGPANLSISLSTLIESLENTQEEYNKDHTYKDSPIHQEGYNKDHTYKDSPIHQEGYNKDHTYKDSPIHQEGCNKDHTYKHSPIHLSADNTPTHVVADMAMEQLLHSSDGLNDLSPPPSSLDRERLHELSEEQSDSFNASNSNCSCPSSTEPFAAKERVDGDGSICDGNHLCTATFLDSELSFESDLSSYTSEVSQY